MKTFLTAAALLLIPAAVYGAEPRWLSEQSQPGDVGQLGVHVEVWRGKTHWNGATVLEVMDANRAIVRHSYGVTSRGPIREHVFQVRGVDTEGWDRGEVVVLPKPLKVVDWYDYKSASGELHSIQVIEPVPATEGDPAADAALLAKREAEAREKALEALLHTFTIKGADGSTSKVRAIYRSFSDGKYRLELPDGKTVAYSARELSAADLAYIREQARKAK